MRVDLLWSKVDKTAECWLWRGRTNKQGYGRYGGGLAHRVIFERLHGSIDSTLELDHLCRTPACVRPDHLEPVTRAENMRRRYADYDSCVSGHDYTPENTYMRPSGHRDCRACIRARAAAYRARRSA